MHLPASKCMLTVHELAYLFNKCMLTVHVLTNFINACLQYMYLPWHSWGSDQQIVASIPEYGGWMKALGLFPWWVEHLDDLAIADFEPKNVKKLITNYILHDWKKKSSYCYHRMTTKRRHRTTSSGRIPASVSWPHLVDKWESAQINQLKPHMRGVELQTFGILQVPEPWDLHIYKISDQHKEGYQ